jgi:polyisoprenyl-teichoic acid--peptidoglycan teichoic acid transferase
MGTMQRNQAIILGVVAVVALAVIGFLLLSGGSDEPPEASASPSASASASASVAPSASATPALNAELLDRRWTVLFVGLDTDSTRESRGEPVNSDALMLVSVSADQSEVSLVSLPRDTIDVPLPDGSTYERKINALYGEEGLDGLVEAMEALYEVPIDGYLALNMDDFAALVDGVGGVEVSPEEPIQDPAARIDIDAGTQTLDGSTAEGYVRTRFDQDYGRMRRQQEVVVEIVRGLVDPERDLDARSLIEGLESLDTDLPLDDLATLLEVARRSTDAEVRELVIEPPLITFEGDRGDGRGYVLEPDVEAIRDAVRELIEEE